MNKKGAELSMNVIIIAALALVVLVIIIALFVGKMNIFTKQSDTCINNGGRCVEDEKDCIGPYENIQSGPNYRCEKDRFCCVGVTTG